MASLSFHVVCLCVAITWSLASGQSNGDSASADFRGLGDRFFDWRMSEKPLLATKNDIYDYNDQLEDFSFDKMEQNKDKAEMFLEELENITMADLGDEEQIWYRILKDMLDTYISGYEWKDYSMNPINFLEGIHRNPMAFIDTLPFNTIGDYGNYISRLTKMPTQLAQFEKMMLEAIRKNATLHRVSLRRAEEQLQSLMIGDITKSIFFIPFTKLSKSNIPKNMWSDIRRNGYDAVRSVVKAYRKLLSWLRATYIPRTRSSIGVNKDYYRECLRWHTSSPMTPEQVHHLGLTEVDRINEEMKKILEKANYTGSISEYFDEMKKNSSFFRTSPREILDEIRDIMKNRIDPYLPEMFTKTPNMDIRVIPMPTDGPMAQYNSPTPDGRVPGIFEVNVMQPKNFPTYVFVSLVMHEANPGHHFQANWAMTSDTPMFMKYMEQPNIFRVPFAFPNYNSFNEGWALYAEFLGEELGLYENDYELMGRYSSEIFRAGRLVVDTGIHYYQWRREDAIAYLQNITGHGKHFVEIEIDRYITWPGQACAYKIGELTIRRLRKFAEEMLGDKFDLKEFHSMVLANGNQPLSILDSSVRDWVVGYESPNEDCTVTISESSSGSSVHGAAITLTVIAVLRGHFL